MTEALHQFGTAGIEDGKPRDHDAVRTALERWFAGVFPGGDPRVGGLSAPVGAGGSNETLLFHLDVTEHGVRHRRGLVLRVAPGSYRLVLALDFRAQFELLQVLHGTLGIRVPEPLWFETDAGMLGRPFFIMARVEGKVPVTVPLYNRAGFLFDATPAQRHRAWRSAMEELARIARAPVDGLAMLRGEDGADGCDSDFAYCLESTRWALGDRPVPVLDAALAWLTRHRPATGIEGLSWGDARFGNMIFGGDFALTGVLDWEMANLGGPVRDLGWWLFFDEIYSTAQGVARLDGLGSREETIALWLSHTGIIPRDLGWYELYAGFQVAVLVARGCRLLGRQVPGQNESNNAYSRFIAERMGLPPPLDFADCSRTRKLGGETS